MRKINRKAKAVLDVLTNNGQLRHKKYQSRCFEPLVVEKLETMEHGTVFSVAHYYEQNGDLIADPDMTFLLRHGEWYPMSYYQPAIGLYQEAIINDNGKLLLREKLQSELAVFAGMWMSNIKEQGFLKQEAYV
ncbi:MAG: hypothetical protein HQM11_07860 [SAR324 cluster bacterium]|nr:hypothetical protein [SAR324 cluster bacterium]